MEENTGRELDKIDFLIISIITAVALVVCMILCKNSINKVNKDLDKIENRKEVIEMYNKLTSLNENDTLYLGKEYKVTNIKSGEHTSYNMTLKNTDEINLFYDKGKTYPNIVLSFSSNQCFIELNWINNTYKIGKSFSEELSAQHIEGMKLYKILKSIGDNGLDNTCQSLRKNVKL